MVDPHRDYTREYGQYDEYGIGIVGAGQIVEQAHLPAYEKAGFDVRGVTDLDRERARTVADSFGIDIYDDLDELLDDSTVDVVDIAVPPYAQRDVVEQVVGTGRHVLLQKPLSNDLDEAREIAALVDDAGVVAAVNQQLRWEKSIRTVHEVIDRGELGTPLRGRFDFGIVSDWSGYPWLQDSPRLDLLYFGIHYLDAFRYLFGDPERTYASVARTPGREEVGETRSTTILEYEDDLRATLEVTHDSWAEQYADFRFEGTDGVVRGTVGLFMGIGDGAAGRFEFRSRGDDEWETHDVANPRFPDAFIGSMGSLLECIETGATPSTAPDDNVRTLRLVNAAYKSTNEKCAVDPADVTTDHYPES